jgi:hypothetical protein
MIRIVKNNIIMLFLSMDGLLEATAFAKAGQLSTNDSH